MLHDALCVAGEILGVLHEVPGALCDVLSALFGDRDELACRTFAKLCCVSAVETAALTSDEII